MTSPEEFREFGKAMIDYVADYLENIRDRPVLPNVKPGYLKEMVPEEAPHEPEVSILLVKYFISSDVPASLSGFLSSHGPRFSPT